MDFRIHILLSFALVAPSSFATGSFETVGRDKQVSVFNTDVTTTMYEYKGEGLCFQIGATPKEDMLIDRKNAEAKCGNRIDNSVNAAYDALAVFDHLSNLEPSKRVNYINGINIPQDKVINAALVANRVTINDIKMVKAKMQLAGDWFDGLVKDQNNSGSNGLIYGSAIAGTVATIAFCLDPLCAFFGIK